MLSSIGADGSLYFGDGHIQTVNVLLCQRLERQGQGLVVEAVVAVAGRSVLGRDGLTDGAQVELQVHLDELEDSLTDTSLGGAVRTGGHVRRQTTVILLKLNSEARFKYYN